MAMLLIQSNTPGLLHINGQFCGRVDESPHAYLTRTDDRGYLSFQPFSDDMTPLPVKSVSNRISCSLRMRAFMRCSGRKAYVRSKSAPHPMRTAPRPKAVFPRRHRILSNDPPPTETHCVPIARLPACALRCTMPMNTGSICCVPNV